jgi:alkylation response protein AidB-like acyl-CoA dehydrogenase
VLPAFQAAHAGLNPVACSTFSEPELGSDAAATRTAARRDGDEYAIAGQKMWLTNGATANLVALLVRTEEGGATRHRNLTLFLIEKEPGFGGSRPRWKERPAGAGADR